MFLFESSIISYRSDSISNVVIEVWLGIGIDLATKISSEMRLQHFTFKHYAFVFILGCIELFYDEDRRYDGQKQPEARIYAHYSEQPVILFRFCIKVDI